VKDLLAQIQQTCNDLKDKNEIAIIEKHNYNAKRYAIVFTSKAAYIFLRLIFKYLYNIFKLRKINYKK